MFKLLDKETNKFVKEDDELYLGIDGKVYEIYVVETRAGSHLERNDVSERYIVYHMRFDDSLGGLQ